MKKNETVAEFINRFFDGCSNVDCVVIRVEADDMLPIIGNRENVLKRLETHQLFVGSFQMVDYNNITIKAIFNAYS